MVLLKKHYGISGNRIDDIMALLLAVVSDWIPGFKTEGRRGRPRILSTYFEDALLIRCIDDIRGGKPGYSLSKACRTLTHKKERDRWKRYYDKERVLANRYRDAKKRESSRFEAMLEAATRVRQEIESEPELATDDRDIP